MTPTNREIAEALRTLSEHPDNASAFGGRLKFHHETVDTGRMVLTNAGFRTGDGPGLILAAGRFAGPEPLSSAVGELTSVYFGRLGADGKAVTLCGEGDRSPEGRPAFGRDASLALAALIRLADAARQGRPDLDGLSDDLAGATTAVFPQEGPDPDEDQRLPAPR